MNGHRSHPPCCPLRGSWGAEGRVALTAFASNKAQGLSQPLSCSSWPPFPSNPAEWGTMASLPFIIPLASEANSHSFRGFWIGGWEKDVCFVFISMCVCVCVRVCVCVCVLVAQLCPTLCDPTDCSPPGSSVHGILQQEYWSGLPFLSPIAIIGSTS